MCSQDCLAKMKLLCLNTVQVLLKDAFDKFSHNLTNQNLINLFESSTQFNNQTPVGQASICEQATTSVLNNRPDLTSQLESVDLKEEGHFTLDLSNFNSSPVLTSLINNQNCQNQLNQNERSLPRLVLCNLMQNLVGAISEQCVKQLPASVTTEKKKRKRKRKRKKSKLPGVGNEICDERSCSSNEQETTSRPMHQQEKWTANESGQMKQTEYSIDKIREMDGRSSVKVSESATNTAVKSLNPMNKHNRLDERCKSFASNKLVLNSELKLNNVRSSPNESKTSALCKNDFKSRKVENRSSSSANLVHSLNRHSIDSRNTLKRKREDSPNYKDRKRITSARKPPTFYKRKHPSSFSFTEHSCYDASPATSSSSES